MKIVRISLVPHILFTFETPNFLFSNLDCLFSVVQVDPQSPGPHYLITNIPVHLLTPTPRAPVFPAFDP